MAAREPIRCGLVGYGMVSSVFHAPLISHARADFHLTHVVERSSDNARQRYPHILRCTSLEDLLATDVELVIIATPSASHFDNARDALLAGKHVVCEKPFTVTFAEAQELDTIACAKKKMLTVFHNRRWDADFLTLRRVIEAGVLGELVEFEAHYDRYRPALKEGNVWRERDEPGSGILYDLGSHMIDQALQLFGRPSAVAADIRKQRSSDAADDYFDVDLRYADRPAFKVTLKAGCVVRKLGPRYVVHGVNGSFVKHGIDVQEDQLKTHGNPGMVGWGVEPEADWGVLHVDAADESVTANASGVELVVSENGTVESLHGSYQAFYAGVASAVRDGTMPPVLAADAALVIMIIELAKESARTGVVVPVPVVA